MNWKIFWNGRQYYIIGSPPQNFFHFYGPDMLVIRLRSLKILQSTTCNFSNDIFQLYWVVLSFARSSSSLWSTKFVLKYCRFIVFIHSFILYSFTSQYLLPSRKISVEFYLKILREWTKQMPLSKMRDYSIFYVDFRWFFGNSPSLFRLT